MKNNGFLRNAAVVSLGGFLAKALGAAYRVPLAGVLGGYGSGLYQMAYPFFCVLLNLSSAGIPNAFARIVSREAAEGRESFSTVRAALSLFAFIGILGGLIMCLLAPLMALVQGERSLVGCYYALAPSVLLVSLIAVLRGYFQGRGNMKPTAFSELVEQGIKALFGIALALLFRHDVVRAVTGTLVAVSLSEAVALGCLFLRYQREQRRYLPVGNAPSSGILKTAIPAMLSASLLPLSQMVDSVLIVRLLSRYTARSVALYGLYAGGAIALVNLPVGLAYGLAAASVPSVSTAFAKGEYEEGKRRAVTALLYTVMLSLPCAVGLFGLAKFAVNILYPSLGAEDAQTLISLVKICALSTVTLSGVQTLSACLTGMGRARLGARSMLVAIAAKFVVEYLLVKNPAFSVLGAAIASDCCYLVAFSLDLYYTVRRERHKGESYDYHYRLGSRTGGFDRTGEERDQERRQGTRAHGAHLLGRRVKEGGRFI